jgi:OOP family OmpA-OmpF porin
MALALGVAGCAQSPALPPEPVAQKNVTVGQEAGTAVHNKIEVRFASGSDSMMPDADKQLDIAARLFRDVRPVSMFSIGYSDAVGNEFNNLLLSARRARTVKTALVARGIPANQILLRAYGQSDPIDRAHPDAPENRRVIVTWDIM